MSGFIDSNSFVNNQLALIGHLCALAMTLSGLQMSSRAVFKSY